MELQTKFLYIKTHSGEDLVALGVFPTDPENIDTFDFKNMIYAMFPAKVTYKPKSFYLSDWTPLSKAKLFKIPMFAVVNVDTPVDQAADEYTMFLIEKKVDIDVIRSVLSDHFEEQPAVDEKPQVLH